VPSFALHGLGVSGGIAIGRAQLVSHATLEVAHYTIPSGRVESEIARLDHAIAEVRAELHDLRGMMIAGDAPAEFGAFLDVHAMILADPTLSETPKRHIAEQRCNAEWALTVQMNVLVEQFEDIEDAYLRERKADVVQVVERILKRLLGKPGSLAPAGAEQNTILVAHDLSPADVIQFKTHRYAGFITDLGGVTSHTAIVARSLAVPAVAGTHNGRALIRENELLVLDGTNHVVIVNPDKSVLAEYRLKQTGLELERAKLRRLKTKPAMTIDGHAVELQANIELPGDLAQALDNGATGRRPVPLGVPVPEPGGAAVRGRAVRGVSHRGCRHGREAGDDPHVRPGRRQAQGGPGRPRPGGAESRARAACGALLPGRAAALPHAASRDPARVALRPGEDPGPDAVVTG
jgi:phosphotransferase system enzyme I (PtsI)